MTVFNKYILTFLSPGSKFTEVFSHISIPYPKPTNFSNNNRYWTLVGEILKIMHFQHGSVVKVLFIHRDADKTLENANKLPEGCHKNVKIQSIPVFVSKKYIFPSPL